MHAGKSARSAPVIVAIPARDEEEEIGECLRSLSGQQGARPDAVVICLNNTRDGSRDRIARTSRELAFPVHLLDVDLPSERAFASVARRMAMDHAAGLAGNAGVLLTTDADGRAAPDWLMANLAALSHGAEAVAGRAEIEPVGARLIPAHLHEIDARECAYAALLDEINALIDPDPCDPWPRHDEHTGASIAVTVAAYHRAGGMPQVPLGEDRAFFAALRRVDARIRHEPDAKVIVSARTIGRASGGMADTMRLRMQKAHEMVEDRLEPVPLAVRRAKLRARFRRMWMSWDGEANAILRLSSRLQVDHETVREALAERYFGTGWQALEQASPALVSGQLSVSELPLQTARAKGIRDQLRSLVPGAADPADKPGSVAAA